MVKYSREASVSSAIYSRALRSSEKVIVNSLCVSHIFQAVFFQTWTKWDTIAQPEFTSMKCRKCQGFLWTKWSTHVMRHVTCLMTCALLVSLAYLVSPETYMKTFPQPKVYQHLKWCVNYGLNRRKSVDRQTRNRGKPGRDYLHRSQSTDVANVSTNILHRETSHAGEEQSTLEEWGGSLSGGRQWWFLRMWMSDFKPQDSKT